MTEKEKLQKAKIDLHHLLLCKDVDELTDAEINVMYELGKDKDVQDRLKTVVDKIRTFRP